ncbi:acetoacetate--CoA ligase [Larkinella terrae]|uniref:Acetoacetate--CoA ligase n=1 Tax=Larkinella terrae TaxID=2025311 RepID=A0A7K0EFU1_9BACT|nr:acetoacetate--CoA ligase [Larkinella terrae]MRS60431.1 acetoacetate--CoA ligase [Larkinella terrae]
MAAAKTPKQPETKKPLWKPDRRLIDQSQLKRYLDWLFVKKGLYFRDYHDLWDWSVTDLEDFWQSIWQFFNVQSHRDYQEVIEKPASGMIGTRWFVGATLNYAEHVFRNKTSERPALLFQSEQHPLTSVSWSELEQKVAAIAQFLRENNVRPGDRVVSVLPNIPEAVVAFLATTSVGAIWSSCSPDFGTPSIVDRFRQIEPKVLFAVDGYSYNGKKIDKTDALEDLQLALPSLKRVVWVSNLDPHFEPAPTGRSKSILWNTVLQTDPAVPLTFEPVPFDHPIWILFSSGTTGKPKAITHSVGGCLLEHLKALALHQDVQPGDRYFWYSTTGWMMWNYSVASLLVGATLVIYDGSAGYPTMDVLWNLADRVRINHFGAGAAYLLACMRAGLSYTDGSKLAHLKTIGSTGSPLPPEGFRWVYESVKKDVWLISISGGTDICSAFVGGCPLLPVYEGEIQCRLLGCKLESFDENAKPVREELGEMVILEPMPSMPLYFWNDNNGEPNGNQKYRASYFEQYDGIWRHGDWIKITDRKTVIIYGRSDATLNRDGVRIGTSEVYSAVESIPEVADSLVVCLELPGGRYFMPLFVVLKGQTDGPATELREDVAQQIRLALRSQYSPRHVPDALFQVPEIPYTISGKKVETPIKKILMGLSSERVASRDTLRNPSALDVFIQLADTMKSDLMVK